MSQINPTDPFVSARLLMRPPVADDIARFYAIFGDPDTQRFNPAGPIANVELAQQVLAERIEKWHRHGYDSWALALREQPERVIGFGGLSWSLLGTQHRVNLGYRFDTQVWGMGLATEMALASLKFGFEGLAMNEIFAIVRENHQASRHVLEKAGLRLVDTLDDAPGNKPSLVYSMMRSEYQDC
ncbi:GNAT family N-acetyltransferase [Pseudomonas lundensis]|uniref:GNAT family N-acetyltransferase n=1 Tax=Serratia proteamaculans TaxID=28151 RepID=UPI0029821E89|nr:GNAT family N-acetyltransferase [Serratia proteamaculans]MDW5500449.1 GNAT family N-acetyltransferase [Serratia proteamaculans]MDW5505515.1 GNAT family N-acetyltransferase [Pseudomonas lundensis]